MKKVWILLFLYCTINTAFAQSLSYGILLGINTSASASKESGLLPGDGSTTFTNRDNNATPSFGAYAEYNFTERWGIKTEILFHKITLTFPSILEEQLKISMTEISPNIKLDFGNEYRKGGYLLFGPRITLLNKISFEGEKNDEGFTKTLFGFQTGIGTRLLEYFDLEFKLKYDFTPFYKNTLNSNNDFFFGANLNLGIDVERLLYKTSK